jgi:hypothetical protein
MSACCVLARKSLIDATRVVFVQRSADSDVVFSVSSFRRGGWRPLSGALSCSEGHVSHKLNMFQKDRSQFN